MHPTEKSRDELFQRFESLRNVARGLIHAHARLVRVGTGPGLCQIKVRSFTISHNTPFNRATLPQFRNDAQRLEGQIRQKYQYELHISEGLDSRFEVGWDDKDELYVHWFSHEQAWDDRFLRYAEKLPMRDRLIAAGMRLIDGRPERSLLRRCAGSALEQFGFRVQQIDIPGIPPGSRLKASTSRTNWTIAVRTCRERMVELKRNGSGNWRTIPSVDEVVVAVPAQNEPMCVEVLGFNAEKLLDAFDALVSKVEKQKSRKKGLRGSVFIALDPLSDDRSGGLRFDLKAKSDWSIILPVVKKG